MYVQFTSCIQGELNSFIEWPCLINWKLSAMKSSNSYLAVLMNCLSCCVSVKHQFDIIGVYDFLRIFFFHLVFISTMFSSFQKIKFFSIFFQLPPDFTDHNSLFNVWAWSLLVKNSKQLSAINYFYKKAPSQVLDGVPTTPLMLNKIPMKAYVKMIFFVKMKTYCLQLQYKTTGHGHFIGNFQQLTLAIQPSRHLLV